MTRVSETIGGIRELILAASDEWLKARPGSSSAGLVVYTRSAHERAEHMVNKQHLKQSQAEYKTFNALAQQSFACVTNADDCMDAGGRATQGAVAEAALAQLQKKLNVVALHEPRMMIMTLCLLVYRALEYRIRQTLLQQQQGFPSQLGTMTKRPSARWVFQFFAGIHVMLIDQCREIILSCNKHHLQLLNLLGQLCPVICLPG